MHASTQLQAVSSPIPRLLSESHFLSPSGGSSLFVLYRIGRLLFSLLLKRVMHWTLVLHKSARSNLLEMLFF